jgi:DNA processing protein
MDRRDTHATEALAWLGLGLVSELQPREAFALVEGLGTVEAVLQASPDALVAAGVRPVAAAAVSGAFARAQAEADRLSALGATLVAWSDPAYPERLRTIADPPLALAVRGGLAADEPAVAVVGARRASAYGRRIAEELGRGLAQAGLTVVSGLAAGIDAAAHQGALAGGGRTVAVLATGVDRVYPPWHRELAEQVAASGALVSEFACGTPPLQFHFPRRNRIISGLALGTVVVEAAERSGSLITARYALEQGRDVFAVPGPVGVPLHRGPHRLIQQGARLVTGVEDVLEELAPALIARVQQVRAAAAEATLSAEERRVLDALDGAGRHVDDVIRTVGLTPGAALETLLALELRGLVRQSPGKRFERCAA